MLALFGRTSQPSSSNFTRQICCQKLSVIHFTTLKNTHTRFSHFTPPTAFLRFEDSPCLPRIHAWLMPIE